ncbi:DMT family transporter [Hephaestia sp. GCM10023244]|uniref:DMT family transporter n=1 Tax=unclassified Hephaestia TaxID=2631281 RepID=UPI0020771A35|nr:DMT family transporter [Hephaestia sp. MAHUQ-44]MCM8731190.1 DMT family transporter [Hephaestia sp. MAHUQ-44]
MHDATASRKTTDRPSLLPITALIVGNIALAFGPWFVRLTDVGPVAAGFWRLSLAVPLLFAGAVAGDWRPRTMRRATWFPLALAGLCFAGDLGAWHVGILKTTMANATLFGNSATLIYPIYGFLIARAWPTRMQGLALLMALAGGALLMGRSYDLSPENFAGDLLCMFAGVLYAGYFIIMARVSATTAPLPALALSSLVSTLPLLLFALALGEKIWPTNWGPLVTLALLSQVVGQSLMIYALGKLSPLVIGIALLTQPVVSGAIGWFAYDEVLGAPDFVGAILVGLALVLVRRRSPAPVQLAPVGCERDETGAPADRSTSREASG